MLIFCLIAILQLIAAQSNAVILNPIVIHGPDVCQSRRAAVDLATSNTSQSVRAILSTLVLSLDAPCGHGRWTRVAYLNMSDPLQQCPTSWRLYSANGVRACGHPVRDINRRMLLTELHCSTELSESVWTNNWLSDWKHKCFRKSAVVDR